MCAPFRALQRATKALAAKVWSQTPQRFHIFAARAFSIYLGHPPFPAAGVGLRVADGLSDVAEDDFLRERCFLCCPWRR